MNKLHTKLSMGALGLLLSSSPFVAATIVSVDFNSLQKGEVLTNQFSTVYQDTLGLTGGVTFGAHKGDTPSTDKSVTGQTLVIFDTEDPVPSTISGNKDGDPDLAYNSGWVGGNLEGQNPLYKLMVIAENTDDADKDGLIDVPDDNTSGGNIRISSDLSLKGFGMTVLDFEPGSACCIEFFYNSYDQKDRVAQVFFNSNTPGELSIGSNSGNDAYDGTVEYAPGNNADNVANNFFLDSDVFNNEEFNRIQINFSTSGGFDDFQFEVVPEPSTYAAIFGAAALALALYRRKRK